MRVTLTRDDGRLVCIHSFADDGFEMRCGYADDASGSDIASMLEFRGKPAPCRPLPMAASESETIALHGRVLQIRRIASEELAKLASDPLRFCNDPINWASLGVVAVERYLQDDGATGLRVYIEEASPSATQLREALRAAIEQRGHVVEVVTSW